MNSVCNTFCLYIKCLQHRNDTFKFSLKSFDMLRISCKSSRHICTVIILHTFWKSWSMRSRLVRLWIVTDAFPSVFKQKRCLYQCIHIPIYLCAVKQVPARHIFILLLILIISKKEVKIFCRIIYISDVTEKCSSFVFFVTVKSSLVVSSRWFRACATNAGKQYQSKKR